MSDDLVKRLRQVAFSSNPNDYIQAPLAEAANEIERLRAELHAAGDGDTWREACGRCEAEIAKLREWKRTATETINAMGETCCNQGKEIERLRSILAQLCGIPVDSWPAVPKASVSYAEMNRPGQTYSVGEPEDKQ